MMRSFRKQGFAVILGLGVLVAACGGPTAASTTSATNPTATLSQAALATNPTPTALNVATSAAPAATVTADSTVNQASAAAGALVKYDLVADGTTADYRVREQLVRMTLPSDAVGKTSKVTGSLVLGADGKVVADQSKFVIDLTSLQSDSSMRDGFIGRSTLNLSSYPTASFVPTSIEGLPSVLPMSGAQSFKLVGNLTIHGVTRLATWTVNGQVSGNDVTGQAATNFKFEDFGMTAPKAGAVASVVDDVKLELTFHLVKSA